VQKLTLVGGKSSLQSEKLTGAIFFEGNNFRYYTCRSFFEELIDDKLQGEYFQQDAARPHCAQDTGCIMTIFLIISILIFISGLT
jgi:hypothetical protein